VTKREALHWVLDGVKVRHAQMSPGVWVFLHERYGQFCETEGKGIPTPVVWILEMDKYPDDGWEILKEEPK
jgi:hypothetical protein